MQPNWFAASKAYIQGVNNANLLELRRRYLELVREADTDRDRELFLGILNEIDTELGKRTVAS